MTGPTYSALRAHHERIDRMYADPECVGELLLVGVAMARSIDLDDPPFTDDGHMPMRLIAERVYGNRRVYGGPAGVGLPSDRADSHPRRRINDLFRLDARRYRPDDTAAWHTVTCGRPMQRRDGLCGRAATTTRRVTDPATGLRQWVGACGNKLCKQWLAGLVDRNRAELDANPPPVPAANCGGVLERHLPEIDWWTVWRALDPRWTPPPEGRPFERPRLQLLTTDAPDEAPVVLRPALVVHQGGWR